VTNAIRKNYRSVSNVDCPEPKLKGMQVSVEAVLMHGVSTKARPYAVPSLTPWPLPSAEMNVRQNL